MARTKLTAATPENFEGATLMRMRMENIKCVRLIDLTFDKPLTVIGGDFSQGKSTFLSGYEWCFGGKAVVDMDPIKHGKQSGTILCELGDGETVKLRVLCTLERVGETGWTRTVELDIPGHLVPSKVQAFLEALAGKESFDPMYFNDMPADKQYETLRNLVGNFDFDTNKKAIDETFANRTEVNRDQKREQAAADAIEVAAKPPYDRIDESALTAELQRAGQTNLAIQQRQARRDDVAKEIDRLRTDAKATREGIEAAVADIRAAAETDIADLEQQLVALQVRLKARRDRVDTDIEAKALSLNEAADATDKRADEQQARLDGADKLPDPIPTEEIVARLAMARDTNRERQEWATLVDRKAAHQAEADRLAAEAATLTEEIDALEDAKRKAIQEAKLPVEGIGFGDGVVTLNGVPWKQGGESERIDASTAIGMALNPRLKVILIRSGSGVARRMRERIQQRAKEKGYRVLMEVVDTPPGTHVVIEDGAIKQLLEPEAVPA